MMLRSIAVMVPVVTIHRTDRIYDTDDEIEGQDAKRRVSTVPALAVPSASASAQWERARLANFVKCSRKASSTLPMGPLRCLEI